MRSFRLSVRQDRETNLQIKYQIKVSVTCNLRYKYSIRLDLDEQAPALRAQWQEPSASNARNNELRVSPPAAKENSIDSKHFLFIIYYLY